MFAALVSGSVSDLLFYHRMRRISRSSSTGKRTSRRPGPVVGDLDQVLLAKDLSIFADLGLDEMELGVTWADLTSIAEDGSGPCPIRVSERT
jgi:hypothetical protein